MAKNKTASSKSKFDFQKFFLEKGEKIGLIIAGVGFALLALFGIMAAAGAANPNKVTSDIKAGVESVDARLTESPDKPPDVQIPNDTSVFVVVKPTDFPTPNSWFNVAGTISEKRNNPTLLPVIEGAARYQIGGFGVVSVVGDQVAIIKDRQAPPRNNVGAIGDAMRKDRNKAKGIGPKAGEGPPPPPPPAPVNPNPMPGGGLPKGAMPKGGPGVGGGRASEAELTYVSVDSTEINNAALAVDLRPVRMARIQGIVPYKMQVEKHLRALRLNDESQLVGEKSEPTYKGFNVERQILAADGKTVVRDWTPFDHLAAMKNFQEPGPDTKLLFAAYEKLDEKIAVFVPEPIHELFLKAPLLAHGAYEPVQLVELGKALQDLEKSGPPKDLTDKQKAMKGKGNQFDPPDLVGGGQVGAGNSGPVIRGAPPGGRGAPPGGKGEMRGSGTAAARTNAASIWMLQFFDPTIEAGFCYKYRVQLKAVNPNFGKKELVSYPGLAAQEEIISEWFEIPDVVYAKPEEYLYAHGEKVKERSTYGTADYDTTNVKYHRWFDYIRVTKDGGRPDPIGEWVIADVAAKRGQLIQETKKFRLPLWSMVLGGYAFRDPISKVGTLLQRIRGENVDIEFRPLTDVLLVDFDGGSGTYRFKSEAVADACVSEILIITDEGTVKKVSARNTVADKVDPERKVREDNWLKWLEEVRTAGEKNNNPAPAGKAG